MEKNKVIENKKPVYVPEPLIEFIPTDLSTIDFSKYIKPIPEVEPTVKFNTTEGSMSMYQISHGGI